METVLHVWAGKLLKEREARFMEEQETIFDRWAKERNITVEEMKAILSARIETGLKQP